MREIKFNVYSYDELSDEAKENALKSYSDNLLCDEASCMFDDETNYIQDVLLPEKGFSNVTVEAYDERGYGYYRDVRIKGYISAEKLSEIAGTKVIPEYSDGTVGVDYPHNVICSDDELLPEGEEGVLAWERIEAFYKDVCREISKIYETAMDYVYSDEFKIESMSANGWEFKEDGTWYL